MLCVCVCVFVQTCWMLATALLNSHLFSCLSAPPDTAWFSCFSMTVFDRLQDVALGPLSWNITTIMNIKKMQCEVFNKCLYTVYYDDEFPLPGHPPDTAQEKKMETVSHTHRDREQGETDMKRGGGFLHSVWIWLKMHCREVWTKNIRGTFLIHCNLL